MASIPGPRGPPVYPWVNLVLWCGMFAPKERLEWYHGLALHHHGTGLARRLHFDGRLLNCEGKVNI